MEKQTKQKKPVEPLALQTLDISSEQAGLRVTQLDLATKQFAKKVTKDAFSARDELVKRVFERLLVPAELDWTEHAELCVAICDIRARDGLLRMLHDRPEARLDFQAHLIREVSRSQQEFTACLATVYAGISWLDGHTELTRLAVDRALEIDPAYSLAQLLDIALRHNVPSSVWSSSLAAVSFDACLKGAA
jgi:hypothetical protein